MRIPINLQQPPVFTYRVIPRTYLTETWYLLLYPGTPIKMVASPFRAFPALAALSGPIPEKEYINIAHNGYIIYSQSGSETQVILSWILNGTIVNWFLFQWAMSPSKTADLY